MHRRRHRLLTVAAATLALVTPMAKAGAATRLVSLAQAAAAVPPVTALPGHPRTLVTSTIAHLDGLHVCIDYAERVPFTGAHAFAVTYQAANSDVFVIDAVVFHTVADAQAARIALVRAEAGCSRQMHVSGDTFTRTLSRRYGAGQWTGWRTIDHLDVPGDQAIGIPARSNHVSRSYLFRGNVLLDIRVGGHQQSPSDATGPVQDAERKAITHATLARFAKL
jgi:hypothetical protein